MFKKPEHQMLGHIDVSIQTNHTFEHPTGNIFVEVNAQTIVIRKTLQNNGNPLICQTIKPITQSDGTTVNNVIVYPDYIKLQCPGAQDVIHYLPSYVGVDYLVKFTQQQGNTIKLENNIEEVDYKGMYFKLKANNKDLYLQAYGGERLLEQFNAKIIGITGWHEFTTILLSDGTAHKVQNASRILFDKHLGELQKQLNADYKIARDTFLETVQVKIPEAEKTVDGQNKRQVFYNIDRYLNSGYFSGYHSQDRLENKHTYEALTKMLNDPDNAPDIAQEQFAKQPQTRVAKNVAIGVLMLAAAAVLIGVSAACFVFMPIALPLLLPGMLAAGGAAALVTAASFRFNRARVDHKYQKNIGRVKTFFSEPAVESFTALSSNPDATVVPTK